MEQYQDLVDVPLAFAQTELDDFENLLLWSCQLEHLLDEF
jgi:hypothetical protein